MASEGKVKALRALFEKNASSSSGTTKPPISPAEFEKTRASVARHNLKYAARRASRLGAVQTLRPQQQQPTSASTGNSSTDKPAEWMTFGDSDAFWLPELEEAIDRNDDAGVNRAVLKFFFEEHDPSRVNQVDELLKENVGREETLFLELSTQYPEPSINVAFALVDAEKKIEESKDWAKFDDEPILNGVRRPTGIWTVNYSPWQE